MSKFSDASEETGVNNQVGVFSSPERIILDEFN